MLQVVFAVILQIIWVERKNISGQPIKYVDANSINYWLIFVLFGNFYAKVIDKAVEMRWSENK